MKLGKGLRFLLVVALAISLLLAVVPVPPVQAAQGSISLFPTSGAVGTGVTATGTGFSAGKNYFIYFESNVVTSGSTGTGAFTASFYVPQLARITSPYYLVRVETRNTDGTLADTSTEARFQITPAVGLGTGSGYVGDTVFVSGTGFASSSVISIYFDNTVVATAAADGNGRFSNASLIVPAASKGSHTVKGRDLTEYSPSVIFNVNQKINVSPDSGAVADKIIVNGTGFAPSSLISFYWDDVILSTEGATTDVNGSFSTATFNIPSSYRGIHTVRAQDAVGNPATTNFTVAQKIKVVPTTGVAGTVVTITGNGFEANKTITVHYNTFIVITNPPVIATNSSGSFSGSFGAPAGVPGTFTVEVSDGTYTSFDTFTAVAEAKISRETGPQNPGNVGMELTVSGSGFKPNAAVSIFYSSVVIELTKTTTDAYGAFSVKVTIPPSTGGEHTISATDGTTIRNFPFYMEKDAPAVSELVTPVTTAKGKLPKVKSITQFDWKDITDPSGVTYTFQIAIDRDFNKIAIEKEWLTKSDYALTEKEKLPSNKRSTPYYWRLKATDGAFNESVWGTPQAFNVGFAFELTGWILYALLGLGGILLFLIGFFWGTRRAMMD